MNFKHIYIVESIDTMDNNNWRNMWLAQGRYLYNILNTHITSLNKNDRILCHYVDIQNRDDWRKLWDTLKKDCRKGEFPLIHFICHGSPQGPTISGYRKLRWFDMIQRLRSITKFYPYLFVTFNICNSACSKDVFSEKKNKKPFMGCIFYDGNISLNSIDRDKTRFRLFYKALISGETIDSAISAFREELHNEGIKDNKWIICLYDSYTNQFEFTNIEKWGV